MVLQVQLFSVHVKIVLQALGIQNTFRNIEFFVCLLNALINVEYCYLNKAFK